MGRRSQPAFERTEGPWSQRGYQKLVQEILPGEEVVEVGNRSHPRAEVKEELVELRRLIPEGTKLAAEIYAALEVGHGLGVEGLELHVFGKGNGAIRAWRKCERKAPKPER